MATLVELESRLAALVDMTFTTLADPTTRGVGLAAYHEAVQQLAVAADPEFPALTALCRETTQRLAQFDEHNEEQWLMLENWPAVAMGVLSDPDDLSIIEEQQAWLASPVWSLAELPSFSSESSLEHFTPSDLSSVPLPEMDFDLGKEDTASSSDEPQVGEEDVDETDSTVVTNLNFCLEDELSPKPCADEISEEIVPDLVAHDSLSPLPEQNFSPESSADEDAAAQLGEAIAVLMDVAMTGEEQANIAWLQAYQSQVGEIGKWALQIDHGGLAAICEDLYGRFDELSADEPTVAWLQNGPMLLMGYAEAPDDDDVINELFAWLEGPIATQDPPIAEAETPTAPSLPQKTPEPHEVVSEFVGRARNRSVNEEAIFDVPEVLALTDPYPDGHEDSLSEVPSDNQGHDDAVADEEDASTVLNEELMAILQAEMIDLAEQAEELANLAATERTSPLGEYTEAVGRFAEAVASLNLMGLQTFGEQLCHQLYALNVENDDAICALAHWPPLVLDYLEHFNKSTSQGLVDYLQQPFWPVPPDAETITQLFESLNQKPALELPEVEARVREATPADVALTIPEDVNPDLLESLLQELPNQMGQFAAAVQKLVRGQGNVADVAAAQRIAHTVKGAANTVGVKGIANLTHHLEDIFEALAKSNELPPGPLAETIVEASDCLEAMTESLLGQGPVPNQSLSVLQNVLDWANRIDQEGVESLATLPPIQRVKVETAAAMAEPEPTTNVSDTLPTLRVPANLVDEMLRQVGESIILTGQIESRITTIREQAQAIRAQTRLLKQLAAELEQLVDVRGVLSPLSRAAGQDFDPLEFDQYNELHTVSRRIVELADDAQTFDENVDRQFVALETLLNDQIQLHRDSQETTLRTRMVQVKTVVPRLQRAVRQTCRLVDKEVELVVRGDHTLVDSDVLTNLVDPLMHMLRNAIDHGVEPAPLRIERGKPPEGRIELGFSREGNSIVVRCRDDGGGLNREAIRKLAENRGLVQPDQVLTEEMLDRLILQPGFSTKSETTQVSGRGIGMDVVYQQVLSLKGSLLVHSERFHGTTFELRLPVSLISTHALLVEAGDQLFALADRGIEQILYPEIENLGSDYYQMEKERCPLHRLEKLLGVPFDQEETKLPTLLLIRDDTGAGQIVAVGPIREARDLVVKPLGPYVPQVPGVLGATILGDGSVSAVIDLPELLRAPQRAAEQMQPRQRIRRRRALVVDDSLSARRSLAQFVADAGFEVHEARDGLEAVGVLDKTPMDMLLVDMEMPRMNGLELTSHVRNREGFQNVPIVMITSRSTSKHKAEAEAVGVSVYLTKPFSETELMNHLEMLKGTA